MSLPKPDNCYCEWPYIDRDCPVHIHGEQPKHTKIINVVSAMTRKVRQIEVKT